MNQVIAVPCEMPGGIGAPMSAHFGHCAAFTLVTLAGEEVMGVEVVANPDHQHGGCMVPVDLLRGHGATHVVAAGMGRRPLIAMLEAGIRPYVAADCAAVGDAVSALLAGKAVPFEPALACGGGDHHH